jgi:hypothetical protein
VVALAAAGCGGGGSKQPTAASTAPPAAPRGPAAAAARLAATTASLKGAGFSPVPEKEPPPAFGGLDVDGVHIVVYTDASTAARERARFVKRAGAKGLVEVHGGQVFWIAPAGSRLKTTESSTFQNVVLAVAG